MTRFNPRDGLDRIVARMVVPSMRSITRDVANEAKKTATDTKTWITMEDEVVRREHREMHGVTIPANLSFKVRSPQYDRDHYQAGEYQWMREPRDPDATPGLTANCRCRLVVKRRGLGKDIETSVEVSETHVKGTVTVHGPLVSESEHGNIRDKGTHWLGKVLSTIKRGLRRFGVG